MRLIFTTLLLLSFVLGTGILAQAGEITFIYTADTRGNIRPCPH